MSRNYNIKLFYSYQQHKDGVTLVIDKGGSIIDEVPPRMRTIIHFHTFEYNHEFSMPIYSLFGRIKEITEVIGNMDLSVNLDKGLEYLIKLNKEQYNIVEEKLNNIKRETKENLQNEFNNRFVLYLKIVQSELKAWLDKNCKDSLTNLTGNSDIVIKVEELSINKKNNKVLQNESVVQPVKWKEITSKKLKELIDKNRSSTGKVNLSAIGRMVGRDPDTIKKWIIKKNLSQFANLKEVNSLVL